MNILVIGNGFDLAHNLPTTYKDFLKFVNQFMQYKKAKTAGEELAWDDNEDITYFKFIVEIANNRKDLFNEIALLVDKNHWIKYFNSVQINEGWIDFESEISKVVQALDSTRKTRDEQVRNEPKTQSFTLKNYDAAILNKIITKTDKIVVWGVEEIKKQLLADLDRLIRCLEIYLNDYVGQITPQIKLPDIEGLDIHCVLSFNYTHTYEKFYHTDKSKKINYDYIHGEIKEDSTIQTCNLILGIDEYLEGVEKNRDNEFIQFKKFYQRIYKKTGCTYVDWINNVETAEKRMARVDSPPNNVYILGHSLDITDGDILSRLINMPNTRTTIFYHSQEALGNQINNLVKVLGEDNLIAMVHGKNARIVLQEQKEAIPTKK